MITKFVVLEAKGLVHFYGVKAKVLKKKREKVNNNITLTRLIKVVEMREKVVESAGIKPDMS